MIITNEMIWNKLNKLERMLKGRSVEEISMNRACSLLHIGYDKLVELVRSKKLEARAINSKKSKSGVTYKIKISSIQDYQSKPDIDLRMVKFESPEQIIKNFQRGAL